MKASYVKISIGVIFILSIFVNIELVNADIVWSEDFDDGNIEDWMIQSGNWSAEKEHL